MVHSGLRPACARIFSICLAIESSQSPERASGFSLSSAKPQARNGLGDEVKVLATPGDSRLTGLVLKLSSATSMSSSMPYLRSAE
eukprot:5062101-Prymnesium_polylepis.1